jgi:hypothetical protein
MSAIQRSEFGSTGADAGIGTFDHEASVNARYAPEVSPVPTVDLTRYVLATERRRPSTSTAVTRTSCRPR